jgi:hypothetical protein
VEGIGWFEEKNADRKAGAIGGRTTGRFRVRRCVCSYPLSIAQTQQLAKRELIDRPRLSRESRGRFLDKDVRGTVASVFRHGL